MYAFVLGTHLSKMLFLQESEGVGIRYDCKRHHSTSVRFAGFQNYLVENTPSRFEQKSVSVKLTKNDQLSTYLYLYITYINIK